MTLLNNQLTEKITRLFQAISVEGQSENLQTEYVLKVHLVQAELSETT